MTKIEHAANVAVILTCIAAVVHMVGGTASGRPKPYKSGETIADSSQLGLRAASKTLIMYESSTCHFCNESLPFYSRLSHQAKTSHVRLVAVTAEDTTTNKVFLLSHGVNVDGVASFKATKLRLAGTPTLVLVRGDGKVIKSWVGKLPPDKENEVMATLLG